jgi:hypothetical protein
MSTLFGGGGNSISQTPTRAMGIDLQGAQYGAGIPVVFGQNKVAGNVIDYMDFKAIAHESQQGGKGGGGGGGSTSYTYSVSFILGLCEGVASIVNVYKGTSTVNLAASGGVSFSGATGQAAWSHLSGLHALGYSGTTLVAFQNLDLGSSASLPNFNFEVAGRNQLGGGVLDAAPSDIFNVICTDTQIGVQFSYLGDMTQFANYTKAAGLVFSPTYKTQSPAQQTLTDLLKYSNCTGYFSEGVLKIVPYADVTLTGNGVTFTPNVTAVADLGPNDFITNGPGDPVTIHRKSPTESQNLVRIEFKDRSNTYHTGVVVASIDQDVIGTGVRADTSESVEMITGGTVARLVAQNLLQRIFYIRNTYEFQLSWRYCYLEPMDVLTLTDANTGLYLTPVRVTEVNEDEHGLLSIVAEEFPQGVSHGNPYGTQANAGNTVDPNTDPGPIDGPYLFRGPGFLVSNNTPEIWCALTGNNALWAGCDIYMSHDGTTYSYLSTTTRAASYGYVTNALPVSVDPDTTSSPNVVLNGPAKLLGGSMADADQFNTLAMIDTEIVSYQTATLAGGPSYTLGYLRRGGYGSAIVSHAINAPFVRLDNNIVRIPVDPSQIGQTVYLKFVSFNAFGLGGRTLASETAYPYVIGTNVELPDVPVTPASIAITGIADGISISWTNPNPAAVGSTSIEFATAGTGPWTVLAQEGPTTTNYAHHFITGATYYYRLRSRGPLIAGGWSSYSATVTSAGVNVAAISAAAAQGISLATSMSVINGGFEALPLGYGWSADIGTGWVTDNGSGTPGVPPNGAMRVAGVGANTGAYRNNGVIGCQPGQVVKAQALCKAVGVTGTVYAYISWLNASLAEIGTAIGNQITGTTTSGSYAVGVAPTGAVYARVALGYSSMTAGTVYADNVVCNQQPSNQSEVPNGGGHNSVTGIDVNGLALIDFTQAGHVSKNIDNVADGTTFVRSMQQVASGSSWIIDNAMFQQWDHGANTSVPGWLAQPGCTVNVNQVSQIYGTYCLDLITVSGASNYASSAKQFIVRPGDKLSLTGLVNAISGAGTNIAVSFYSASNTSISQIVTTTITAASWTQVGASGTAPAGAAYAVITLQSVGGGAYHSLFNFVQVTVNDIRVAGSGARIGDQRNLTAVTSANFGSAWTGLTMTYTSTTTSATISLSASTLQLGGVAIAYSSASVSVSGTAGTTVVYYLYYNDPVPSGGSQSLIATTSSLTAQSSDGYVRVGSVSVVYPSSGTGGGGGLPICVSRQAWVIRLNGNGDQECIRAGDVEVGDQLKLADLRWGYVSHSKSAFVPCVRVTGSSGYSLSCSRTAPLGKAYGGSVLAPDSMGVSLSVYYLATQMHDTVTKVEDIGDDWVQHITCENDFFWAGDNADHLFSHHNMKPPA